MGGRSRGGSLTAVAVAVLVACGPGDGSTGSSSTTDSPGPSVTSTTAPAPTATADGDAAVRRRDVPPEGVPAQRTFRAPTDGCAEARTTPAVEPVTGSYQVGDSVLICVHGFVPTTPVAVEVRLPDGRSDRRALTEESGETSWFFDVGPADPTGAYTITAVQSPTRATGGFAVELPSSPFIATLDPTRAAAGTVFRFGVVSPAPRQAVSVDLYRRVDNRFRYATTVGSVTTDDRSRASYELTTAAGTPTGTYCLVARPFARRCAEFDVT
jgi:hypothetical protein